MSVVKMPFKKASYVHNVQREVRNLSQEVRDKIIARCEAEWVACEGQKSTAWVENATFDVVKEAIRAEIGDDGIRVLFQGVGRLLTQQPLFQKALEALIRIAGMGPHTLLKFAPRAHAALARDSEVMRYERVSKNEARLYVTGLPLESWTSGTTALSMAGAFEGVVKTAGASTEVEFIDFSTEKRSGTFVVRW